MGRPTKLTADRQKTICDGLSAGLSIEASSARAGISAATYHAWINRGEAGEPTFSEFVDETARALACVEERLLESIEWAAGERERVRYRDGVVVERYAERNWNAAAWLLERKFPERYGRQTKVTGELGVKHGIELPDTPAAQDAAADFLRRIAGNTGEAQA